MDFNVAKTVKLPGLSTDQIVTKLENLSQETDFESKDCFDSGTKCLRFNERLLWKQYTQHSTSQVWAMW